MINEHLLESMEALKADAVFIRGIKDTIENWDKEGWSQEIKNEKIKKTQKWVLRVLDYYVTLDMMDIDADLLRLCTDDPQTALRLGESLNEIALILKQNYQYLCQEGTIYGDDGLLNFKFYYTLALSAHIKHIKCAADGKSITPLPPNYIVTYPEMEFMKIGDNLQVLIQKLSRIEKIDFSLSSIKQFIENCFSWADSINGYLTRIKANKSVFEINRQTLNAIHAICNDDVFSSTDQSSFAKALMNFTRPTFRIIKKDRFYGLLFAFYEAMGTWSAKDNWLDAILTAFELEKNDYSSATSRIKKGRSSEALTEFYNKIRGIIELTGI